MRLENEGLLYSEGTRREREGDGEGRGGGGMKQVEIRIPKYNDVWMDNGVETLYRLLKDAQDGSFSVGIDDNSLIITVADFVKFKEAVGIAVK